MVTIPTSTTTPIPSAAMPSHRSVPRMGVSKGGTFAQGKRDPSEIISPPVVRVRNPVSRSIEGRAVETISRVMSAAVWHPLRTRGSTWA